MKRTLIAAFAMATAVSAFGQGGMMMVPDAKSSKPLELSAFLVADAYKKLNAADAYILTTFIAGLPGNYETAILRGLVQNVQEAQTTHDSAQASASSMAPMGDSTADMKMMMDMEPKAPRSYDDVINALGKGQDETDNGLIRTLFTKKLFTRDPLMSPWNERELDAIAKYLVANHRSTYPTRLKYVSLAPRTYAGLPSNWASQPWPTGS